MESCVPLSEHSESWLAGRRLLFVANVDWFFLSHRLPLALAATAAGMRTTVAAADTGRGDEITGAGIEFIPLNVSRTAGNPLAELKAVRSLRKAVMARAPDIIHTVGHKAAFLGHFADTRRRGVTIRAVTGLGSTFLDDRRSLNRFLIEKFYRWTGGRDGMWTLFQNQDDERFFIQRRWADARRSELIAGSGVDCQVFVPPPDEPSEPLIVLPARLLRDKGVYEFAHAASVVRARAPGVRFVLAGGIDEANPSGIAHSTIEDWTRRGVVEWWGHQNDMAAVYQQATVVVLPSYREGMPKALLEAAACGRPIVTTDVPGCRDVIGSGKFGVLIPPHDGGALATAILALLDDDAGRLALGRAARDRALEAFRIESVQDATLRLYERALRADG